MTEEIYSETFSKICAAAIRCLQSSMHHHLDFIALPLTSAEGTQVELADRYLSALSSNFGCPRLRISLVEGNVCVRHESTSSEFNEDW